MSSKMKASDILYLFDRPYEPVNAPKGEDDEKVSFKVPPQFLKKRNKRITAQGKCFDIPEMSIPDISLCEQLGPNEGFSLFKPHHAKLAAHLIKIFMELKTCEELINVAACCRDRLNPLLFNYALSVAILHHPEMKNIEPPQIPKTFAEHFITKSVLDKAKNEAIFNCDIRKPVKCKKPDDTGSNLDQEHRLAYFREDIGVNSHHWHWHLVYPNSGVDTMVRKDRRGELFYYMHHQIIARYNFERLCNNLPRVRRLLNFREPLEEGFYSKLSGNFPGRPSGSRLKNIRQGHKRDGQNYDIDDLEQYRERIIGAIHSGKYITENGTLSLRDGNDDNGDKGIEVLANMLEACDLSPNKRYYGDLHNSGHLLIAQCHDPDNRHLETPGVMGYTQTAMRDPVFYRWHCYIDEIFQQYKETLPPYTVEQLDYSGIRISKVEVNTYYESAKTNEFVTFWKQDDVDMSRGLNFTPRGPLYVRFTHLQHAAFEYNIQVENNGGSRQGTIRIFLAPQFDERGDTKDIWNFRDHKQFFIEMDKFVVPMKPGTNCFERKSTESSITLPTEKIYDIKGKKDVADNANKEVSNEMANFCGCGWPEYLLVPKGNPEGMKCKLFVMVSNYDEDKVEQAHHRVCTQAVSFCGIRDKKYPDKKPMGYPFDRLPRDGVTELKDFLTPNMFVEDVTIRFVK